MRNPTEKVLKIGLLKKGHEKTEYDLTDYIDLNHSESYMSAKFGNAFVLYSKLPHNLRKYYITVEPTRFNNIHNLIITNLNIKFSTVFDILGLDSDLFKTIIFCFELPETFSSILVENVQNKETFVDYWNQRLRLDPKNQLVLSFDK